MKQNYRNHKVTQSLQNQGEVQILRQMEKNLN